jgi:hypothetical protein
MQGSPEQQQNLANTVSGLANQDYYNYLQGALGLYGSGLQGMQGLYTTGANAANNYGNNLGEIGLASAQNAYSGAQAQNNANQSMFSGLGSLLGAASFL